MQPIRWSTAWGVGALLGAAVALSVVLTVVPRFDASRIANTSPGALLSTSADDFSHAAERTLQAQRLRPVVATLGASSMREAFDGEPETSALLSAHPSLPSEFVSLATSGQSIGESLQLLRAFPLPRSSVVLVQVDPERLYAPVTPVRQRFANREWIATWMRGRLNQELWQCASALRHVRVRAGCGSLLLSGPYVTPPPTYAPHYYPDSALAVPTKDSLQALAWSLALLNGTVNDSANFTALQEISRLVRVAQARLVLLRLPADSRVIHAEQSQNDAFNQRMESLRNDGAMYLDLRQSLNLPDSAFYDLHHARPATRVPIQRAVIQFLETSLHD